MAIGFLLLEVSGFKILWTFHGLLKYRYRDDKSYDHNPGVSWFSFSRAGLH